MTEDEIQQKTTPAVVTTMIDAIIQFGNRGHWYGFEPGDQTANLIECVDGFRISVIAGGGVYSIPKPAFCMCAYSRRAGDPPDPMAIMSIYQPWEVPHDFRGPYTALEVGFPTDRPEPWADWAEYADRDDDPTESIYPYVPAQLVRDLIVSHGGEIEKPDSYYWGDQT